MYGTGYGRADSLRIPYLSYVELSGLPLMTFHCHKRKRATHSDDLE